jgi:hypothetical protein
MIIEGCVSLPLLYYYFIFPRLRVVCQKLYFHSNNQMRKEGWWPLWLYINLVHWISDFCLWVSSPSCPTHVLDPSSVSYGWVILCDFYSQSCLGPRSGLGSVLLRFLLARAFLVRRPGSRCDFAAAVVCSSVPALVCYSIHFFLSRSCCPRTSSAGFPLQVSLGSVNFPAGPVSAG